jgi:dTDP-4-amino-4,6-dideoxygalactose transaminase
MIPFNRPARTGDELAYVSEAIRSGHIAGDGAFSRRCTDLVKSMFGFPGVFLTPSCTSALEMAGLLCDFQPGEEVILPSFAHVGTANAFVRAGATIVFADSLAGHPNIDPAQLASLVTPRSKAVVAVHYGGVACDMNALHEFAETHKLLLIEDAAHALAARYRDKNLGSCSDFAAVSFHETKNLTCGLGGMLIVNRVDKIERARRIWNQGTNHDEFEAGCAPYYTWIEPGGSFHLSELNAACLYPQLLRCEEMTARRIRLWQTYYDQLLPLQERGFFRLPAIPEFVRHNGHTFYLLAKNVSLRNQLIDYLGERGYQAVFHYLPLHTSPWMTHNGPAPRLPHCEAVANTIVRLPLFDSLTEEGVLEIVQSIRQWLEVLPSSHEPWDRA